jgi:hypothetical protein
MEGGLQGTESEPNEDTNPNSQQPIQEADNNNNAHGQGMSQYYPSAAGQGYDQSAAYHHGMDVGHPYGSNVAGPGGNSNNNNAPPYQHFGGMPGGPNQQQPGYMSMQQGQDYTYRPPPPPYEQADYRYYQGQQHPAMYEQRPSPQSAAPGSAANTPLHSSSWAYGQRNEAASQTGNVGANMSPGRQGPSYDAYGRDRFGYPSQPPYDYGGAYGYPGRGPSYPRPDPRYPPPYQGAYPMYPGYPQGYPAPDRTGTEDYRHMYPVGSHSPYGAIPRGPFIMDINNNDVLCGRGGATNSHVGNREFRKLVKKFKDKYLSAKKKDKPAVAAEVVEVIRKLDPPGRFLKKDKDSGYWLDIGDLRAKEKTSQALREGAPLIRKQMAESKGDADDSQDEGSDYENVDATEERSASPIEIAATTAETAKLRPGLYKPGTRTDNSVGTGNAHANSKESTESSDANEDEEKEQGDNNTNRKRPSEFVGGNDDDEGSPVKRPKGSNDLISDFVPPEAGVKKDT